MGEPVTAADSIRTYSEDGLWIHEHPDGFIVDRVINESASLGRFDRLTRETWEFIYKPTAGDVIVDVGAGIGSETHRFSHAVGPTGVVVAIEAQADTFACLRRFCELNRLDNVVVVNVAIVDVPGVVTIDAPDMHIASSVVTGRGTVEVEATTLDALLPTLGIGRIDFLKMNIEGAERLAVQGMSESLRRTRTLCVSCHDFKADRGDGEQFRTASVVRDYVRGRGFSVVDRRPDDLPWIRDQINATRWIPALTARARLKARAIQLKAEGWRSAWHRSIVAPLLAQGGRLAAATSEASHRASRSVSSAAARLGHTVKYSRHGYTRVVALKIVVVKLLRLLHLKPPPPGA